MHNRFRLFLDLIPYIWVKNIRVRLDIFLLFALVGASVLINVSIPMVLKKIVDSIADPTTQPSFPNNIYYIVLAYGFLWCLGQVTLQLRGMISYRVIAHSMRLLCFKVFTHIMSLSIQFHLKKKSGEIQSAFNKAQYALMRIVEGLFIQIIPIILEISIAFCIVYKLYGFQYSSVLIATIVIYLAATLLAVKKSVFSQMISNEKHYQSSAYLLDTLINFETVITFNNEVFESKKVDQLLKNEEKATVRTHMRMGYISTLQMVLIGIGLTLITIQAIYGIQRGQLSAGDFILLNGYLLQFALPMSYFGYILQDFQRSFADIHYVFNLLKEKPEVMEHPEAEPLNLHSSNIIFDNVVFRYQEEKEILDGISFKVPAGKTIAIVGETGSGKSTIAKLLLRFFDVHSGNILIGDQNIKNVQLGSLRTKLGVVPQDTILFNRSIYDNIVYAKPDASKKEVEAVIKWVNLDQFIRKLPLGYDTLVGERGLQLSGGERQRIAIARAALKQAEIYIFDEATSSVDIKTERLIQANLEKVAKGRTTLIIAHRLSTVINADEILVLHRGKIIERGTHSTLLQAKGTYANIWHQQIENHRLGLELETA